MNDVRSFHAPNVQLPALVQALTQWYQSQQFEVQTAPMSDGTMLQARQQGGWRSAFGTSSALQVVFRPHGDDLVVEMGAGKWADKAAAGAVGWFLLWPLAFTAAYGAWQQSKLPDRTFEFVERYLAGGVLPAPAYGPVPPPTSGVPVGGGIPAPPSAGAGGGTAAAVAQPAVAAGDGAAQSSAGFCIKCGAPLPSGAAFCHKCGTKVSE